MDYSLIKITRFVCSLAHFRYDLVISSSLSFLRLRFSLGFLGICGKYLSNVIYTIEIYRIPLDGLEPEQGCHVVVTHSLLILFYFIFLIFWLGFGL